MNLVHLDDVVAACELMLARGQDGDAYNLSAPVHPRREQLYPFASRLLGLVPPQFVEPAGSLLPSKVSASASSLVSSIAGRIRPTGLRTGRP